MKDELKQNLFSLIKTAAEKKNMSQRELGKALNVSQPRVSNLLDERKDLFSIDKLVDFAEVLGYDLSIVAKVKETV